MMAHLRRTLIHRAAMLALCAGALAATTGCTSTEAATDDIEEDAEQPAKPSDGAGGAGSSDDGNGDGDGNEDGNSDPNDDPNSGSGGNNNNSSPTNDCCADAATPGCEDQSVQACVCAADDFCCTTAWDDTCVDIATNACGACGGNNGHTPDPDPDPPSQSCEQCILQQCDLDCILDGSCCPSLSLLTYECLIFTCSEECWGWDPPQNGGNNNGNSDACCSPHGGLGCGDANVDSCVCAQDSYCCDTEWDQQCVDEVTDFGCGVCT